MKSNALLTALLAAALVGGCSESSTGPGTDNPQTSTVRAKLVGKTWLTQVYTTIKAPPGANSNPENPERTTLNADGTYTIVNGFGTSSTGAWSLDSNDRYVTLKGRPYGDELWKIVDLSGDMLVMTTPYVYDKQDTVYSVSASLAAEKIDLSLITAHPWKMEQTLFGGSDYTSTAATVTSYKADGTYHADYANGSTKDGTWKITSKGEILMDSASATKRKSWTIMELSNDLMELIDGASWSPDYVRQSTDGMSHSGGKNELLKGKNWKIQSMTLNGVQIPTTEYSSDRLEFREDGKLYIYAKNNHLDPTTWKLLSGGTMFRMGLESYAEITELTATSLTYRRAMWVDQGKVGLVVVKATAQ